MPVYPVTLQKTVEFNLQAATWKDALAVAEYMVANHGYELDYDFGSEGWQVGGVCGEVNDVADCGIGEDGEAVYIDDAARDTFEPQEECDPCTLDDPRQCVMLDE